MPKRPSFNAKKLESAVSKVEAGAVPKICKNPHRLGRPPKDPAKKAIWDAKRKKIYEESNRQIVELDSADKLTMAEEVVAAKVLAEEAERKRKEAERNTQALRALADSGVLPILKEYTQIVEAREQLEKQVAQEASQHSIELFEPHVKQLPWFSALQNPQYKTLLFLAGNRCLGGETEIYDPVAGVTRRVDEIKEPFHVYAWNGSGLVVAEAEAPFTKGYDDLYKVTMDSGEWLVCSKSHRVLCIDQVYRPVGALAEGSKLLYKDITRIDYLRNDVKYDFTVPIYHNYLAGGVISHNSGKTECLITSLVSMLLGYIPWTGEKTRFPVPITARLLGEDFTAHIGRVLIPKLEKYLPADCILDVKKNQAGVNTYYKLKNGSELSVMSYAQDVSLFESSNFHVLACDEPLPRAHWVACKRGLVDYDGLAMLSLTPLKHAWITDQIADKEAEDKTIFVQRAEIYDNPHLKPEAIEEFSKTLTDDERSVRLTGKGAHLQGVVYKDFDPKIHVIDPIGLPVQWTYYASLDTHPRTPHSFLAAAIGDRGAIHVVHDSFVPETPQELGERVVAFHRTVHNIHTCLIDPSSKGDVNRGDSTYTIIAKILGREGIRLELGSKDLSGGTLLLQNTFKAPGGIPSIVIHRNCTNLLWELPRYVWQEFKGNSLASRGESNKPVDANDHAIENLRRLVQLPMVFYNKHKMSSLVARAAGNEPVDPMAGY